METIILENRELLGKKSRNLLKDGFVPAVVYNDKTKSINIKIQTPVAKQVAKVATSTTIFDVKLGDKSFKVLAKDIDFNPVTDEIRHISFFEIDESKEMVFDIPFDIVGISPAVKNNLGTLVKVLPSIEVRCKLADLKPYITIDISNLEHPGQMISVHDIELPNGMSLINKDMEQAAIVTVTELQKEEVAAAPTEETEAVKTTESEDETKTE